MKIQFKTKNNFKILEALTKKEASRENTKSVKLRREIKHLGFSFLFFKG